jgi:GntR family transcriptional repressor for pyruvate dehydrogenase complex
MVEANAADRTVAEHEAIYTALADGDAPLAQAAALMHIDTTERWLRRVHAGHGDEPESSL